MKHEKEILRKKKLALRILLAALTSTSLVGCSKSDEQKIEFISIEDLAEDIPEEELVEVLDSTTEVTEEVEEVEEKVGKYICIPSVIANSNVNIRKSPTVEGELVGKLIAGHTLEMIEELPNGWYKVLYYDQECYVIGDYTAKVDTYRINGEIKKICYATEDIELTIPEELRNGNEEGKVVLPRLECLEIYEENETDYLVQTNDYIGYVAKTSLEELTDTFVVVDISSQELRLYKNNEVILRTPVVTGKPKTPTDEGLFEIYKFKENDYLIGRSRNGKIIYQSYVDKMMKYNGGEGLHDAEYHSCDNGKQTDHGWRDFADFGGNTYLTNGSHGCVNMPHDAAMEVAEYVSLGTPVLVKK